MGASREFGKGCRDYHHVCPRAAQRGIEAGEAQIEADAQTEAPALNVDQHRAIPRLQGIGFAIASLGITNIHVKQVNFVVSGSNFTLRIHN